VPPGTQAVYKRQHKNKEKVNKKEKQQPLKAQGSPNNLETPLQK